MHLFIDMKMCSVQWLAQGMFVHDDVKLDELDYKEKQNAAAATVRWPLFIKHTVKWNPHVLLHN